MATIVTRTGKGSALTFAEGDANFTNLNTDKVELTDLSVTQNSASGGGTLAYNNTTGVFTYTPPSLPAAGIANVVEDTTPQLGGNLDVNGNKITTASGIINIEGATDGNINLTALGTGDINITPALNGDSAITRMRYSERQHALGSTDTPTITLSNGNVQTVTITSGLALPAFAGSAGESVTLVVSGSGTATGTAAYRFAGGNKTLTTLSVVSIYFDGTNYFASIATDFQA